MQVCGQHFSPAMIERIEAAGRAEPDLSRRALSRRVCEWLDWRGPDGRWKAMSCRAALRKLEARGMLRLPAASVFPGVQGKHRGRNDDALEGLHPVQAPLAAVGPVALVLVGHRRSREARVWTALMERDHPLGSGPLCGAQLRYLMRSPAYGWLGGLAFSAAAWHLAPREQWIGWSDAARRENLSRVVNNSRFLIRADVRVPHLASHVLSRCLRRLTEDWRIRYGQTPVLVETFVETGRFAGTSYQAANWHHIGTTRGRGRQDQGHRCGLPAKDIYVYPLHRRWRELLCRAEGEDLATRVPARPPPADWAEEEFGRAGLADARLEARLLSVARDFFARPQANVPQACASRAKTKAAYRFFDHPRVTMDQLLDSHIASTRERVREHRVVLAVQDTTTLNYTTHPATEGLGLLHTIDDVTRGLLLHDTLAFTEDGVPLGLLDVQCWARDPGEGGKKHRRHPVPIEQKKSAKWLRSYRAVAQAQRHCPDTRLVSVGDREADLYELFDLAAQTPGGPDLLVRAERTRNRRVEQGLLWDHLAAQPVAGFQEVHVPRKGSRPARTARLAVRYATVHLQPPTTKPTLSPVRAWAVSAQEVHYDARSVSSPLSWTLVTTVETADFQAACQRLGWYTRRWGIEVYHRTLKSGCRIETRQLATAKRLEACLAIDMVVAWRVYHLVKIGRDTPDIPCTASFEEAEWQALVAYVTKNPALQKEPPTLREATRMVASLGGFLGRKGDGEPGTQTLWLGLQRLDDITAMWCVMAGVPQIRGPTVSSETGYG
jgi:hypothetical protein